MPSAGGGNSGPTAFARVSLSAPINGWDGTPVAFNTVDYDPAHLWDATNHWFAAKASGWYEVAAYPTSSNGGVSIAAIAADGTALLIAIIGGAGNNIYTQVGQHTQVTSGPWVFPPLFGHTHLDVGDTVDFEGSALGASAVVAAGFALSLRMVTAD